MNETQRTGFSERLKTAAEARKAQLANFRAKPTVTAELTPDRAAQRAAEPQSVRRERPAAETPMQRALRLKKAAVDAKPKPPGRDKALRAQASGVAAGASKPWMKK